MDGVNSWGKSIRLAGGSTVCWDSPCISAGSAAEERSESLYGSVSSTRPGTFPGEVRCTPETAPPPAQVVRPSLLVSISSAVRTSHLCARHVKVALT